MISIQRILVFSSTVLTVALFGNCKSIRVANMPGDAIENVNTFWKLKNNVLIPNLVIAEKAWYQDSIGITEICQIFNEQTDTSNTTTIRTIGFRFIDLRKKWAYEYASFTDTASFQRKYIITDSTAFSGGWNFANRPSIAFENDIFLTDTIINSLPHKRQKLQFEFNQTKFEAIGMFRCDIKKTAFVIDTGISKKTGCSLIFMRMNPAHQPNARLDHELKFISRTFPDSVQKVFDAWKKNEHLSPVQ